MKYYLAITSFILAWASVVVSVTGYPSAAVAVAVVALVVAGSALFRSWRA